jgi:GT2 family glycosyltransferase
VSRIPVTIIVPTYGNWWLTERCLGALERHGLPGQQVVVVDDVSPDETRSRLALSIGLDVVLTAQNGGFAASCNTGAALARSDVLLFLNADTEVQAGALAAMVDTLDDPSVGIVGAKLLYPEGGIQHAGLIVDRDGLLRHAHWFRPDDLADADVARDYAVVTGAALAIRAEDFRAAGGFDTAYRNGYEDAELCFRVWASGKRVRYQPKAHIVHVESASTGRFDNDRANFELFRRRWGMVVDGLPRVAPAAAAPNLNVTGGLDARGSLGDEARRLVVALGGQAAAQRRTVSGVDVAIGAVMQGPDGTSLAFVAPADDAEAHAVVATLGAQRYWAPTWSAVERLRHAGVAPERVDMWRAGVEAAETPPTAATSVVAIVSDTTTADALCLALETWYRAKPRLAPLGIRFELRSMLDETALRGLVAAAVTGADPAISAVDATLVTSDATEPRVLAGAATLLVTGPVDRVERIPLQAFASGIDVVAARGANAELARFVSEDAYVEASPETLADALCSSFATGRAERTRRARLEVARRHSPAKANLRLWVLLSRRDDAYDHLDDVALDATMSRAFSAGAPRCRNT